MEPLRAAQTLLTFASLLVPLVAPSNGQAASISGQRVLTVAVAQVHRNFDGLPAAKNTSAERDGGSRVIRQGHSIAMLACGRTPSAPIARRSATPPAAATCGAPASGVAPSSPRSPPFFA